MNHIVVLVVATVACGGGPSVQVDATPSKQDAPIRPPDARPDARPPVLRVFVTSTKSNADLMTAGGSPINGLDGGNNLCNAAAGAAGLGGSWNVWLSTSAIDAIDLIPGNGPWYLVDGTTLVFTSKAALTSNPMSAITLDETGHTTSGTGDTAVWTGTKANGTVDTGATCGDWSATTGISFIGVSGDSNESWTASFFGFNCSSPQVRLYCFES
jgi:hypothetical protein